jgi:hypothetical protein
MNKLDLNKLYVMQDGIRAAEQIPGMIEFVKSGGKWTLQNLQDYAHKHNLKPSPIMEISLFPDGKLMIHDGHHRAIATYLGGRYFLYPNEFWIRNWKYEDYTEINFSARWVTPFDPRTELRSPEIYGLKTKAMKLFDSIGENAALDFINQAVFTKPRDIYFLPEMVEKYKIGR